MNVHKLLTDDRAVSPVVGVALLIAITVILAAVIGGVVLGIGTGGVDTPQAQLQLEQVDDTNEYELHHNGGEPLPEDYIVINGVVDADERLDGDLTAGNSESLEHNTTSEEIVILWEDPNSDSTTVLERFDV
ncbi:hypothetical protein JCM18237_24900 [Halorubrum luteum]